MRLPVRNSRLVKHTYIEETPVQIQLFQRKVVDKNVYATIPKGNMGCDHDRQCTVPNTAAVEPTFVELVYIRSKTFVPFFQIFFGRKVN